MSDPRFTPVDVIETERESVREPAKRWRNRWRVLEDLTEVPSGRRRKKGYENWQAGTFPSKEIAEQRAVDYIATAAETYGYVVVEYLGAFPDGESP